MWLFYFLFFAKMEIIFYVNKVTHPSKVAWQRRRSKEIGISCPSHAYARTLFGLRETGEITGTDRKTKKQRLSDGRKKRRRAEREEREQGNVNGGRDLALVWDMKYKWKTRSMSVSASRLRKWKTAEGEVLYKRGGRRQRPGQGERHQSETRILIPGQFFSSS